MEAKVSSIAEVKEELGIAFGSYLDLTIYQLGSFWLSDLRSTLVWISPDGRHPNLFAWRNPLVESLGFSIVASSIALPDIVNFTAELDIRRTQLQELCTPVLIEEDENWLRSNPGLQIQANCFNYFYAGFERKFELVYGDGKLEVIWVLTAKAEEHRLRELLTAEWGAPMIENETCEVFGQGRVSL